MTNEQIQDSIKKAKAEIIQLLSSDKKEINEDNILNSCEDMMENLYDSGQEQTDLYYGFELLHRNLKPSDICDCQFGFCFNPNHIE